ncbi:hypothetical protein NEOC84_000317|nr:hypothetical protein [Neochlamydia sp. AcF95]NGY94444.1 hypothetical protein [Neochlamydia sp. AcF84]
MIFLLRRQSLIISLAALYYPLAAERRLSKSYGTLLTGMQEEVKNVEKKNINV